MRVVSIAAPGSHSGKTTLLAALCRAFPGRLDAVKFTTVYREGPLCPRDGELACPCGDPDGDYLICEDRGVVERPGTDTGKISAAGARRAHWAIGRPEAYRLLWPELCDRFLPSGARVVTEGNTGAAFIGPDLLVFLYNPWIPREKWKDSAWRILAGADVVFTSPHHPERGHQPSGFPEGVLEKVGRVQPGALRVAGDLSREPSAWKGGDAFLERVGKALDL